MNREQYGLHVGMLRAHLVEDFETGQVRHADVENYDIRMVEFDLREDFLAVVGLAAEPDVVFALHQVPQALSDDGVVVGDEYGDHLIRLHPIPAADQFGAGKNRPAWLDFAAGPMRECGLRFGLRNLFANRGVQEFGEVENGLRVTLVALANFRASERLPKRWSGSCCK